MASPNRIAPQRVTLAPRQAAPKGRTLARIYVEIIAISYAVAGVTIGLIVLADLL